MSIFGVPFRRLIIESPLSPEKVLERLEMIVWNHPSSFWMGSPPKDKLFVGFLSSHDFRLKSLYGIPGNIFKPTFYGTIEPHSKGAEIRVTISLSPLELFMAVAVNLLLIYLSLVSHNVIPILFAIVSDALGYLIVFAPEAQFFVDRFTQELGSIHQEGQVISIP